MRRVYQPSLDDSLGAVPIDNGGSSSKKLATAVQYLGLLTNNTKGVALGTADLDANGKVKHVNLPDSVISEVVNVSGPTTLKVNQTGVYTITDYDSGTTYTLAATSGVATRNGDTITYTAGGSPGSGGFTLNGKAYLITVTYYSVITPNVTAPTNGQTGLSGTVSFTSNAFAMEGGTDTHQSSDWQLSTTSDFATLVSSVTDSASNKTSWSVTGLNPNTTYYARVRYKGVISGYSAWSPVINFSTSTSFTPNAPTITNPTNGQTSVALSMTLSASAFSSPGVDTHYSSDWQIATDAGFTNIVKSATDDTINKVSWLVSGLVDLTVYYARVRYKGASFGYGAWSSTVSFTTIQANSINTPSISSPSNNADGVSLSPTLSSSAFSVTGGSDTHQSSDWQIATDSGFGTIVKSTTADTVNKISWPVTGLAANTTYYARVRYKGVNLPYSAWSSTITFKTIHVNQTSITSPTNGSTGLMPAMTLTSDAFAVTGASDTHKWSNWQIASDAGFTSIVSESVNSTTNLTSWTVNLSLNATYYARVKHTGNTYGDGPWSATVSFSTVANYTPNTPSITSPTTGATNQGPTVSFSSSAFAMNGGSATHTSSDWQIATDSGFATIVSSATGDTTNKVSWTSASLTANTTYYARVRYLASNGIYSGWSTTISFTTKTQYLPNSEEAIILKPNTTDSSFGYYVSIDSTGTRIAIGSNGSTDGYSGMGAVYIYSRSGSTWSLERTIKIYSELGYNTMNSYGSARADVWFGRSVELTSDGSRVVIGAPLFGTNTVGAAFVYSRSGTTWTYEAMLYNAASSNSCYGHGIAINDAGDRVLVGGPNYLTNSGNVNYWTRSGTTWTRQTSLNNPGGSGSPEYYGQGLAISGDGTRVIVGGPGGSRISIFTLGTTSGSLEFNTSGGGYNDQLGYFVDINTDGSVAVAGGYAYNSNAGWVKVYRRSGTTWSTTTVTPSNASSDSYFGRGVSLSSDGNMLVVGAMNADRSIYANTGTVYIFTWNGSSWVQSSEFQASDINASNIYYGRVVAVSNDKSRLVVGNEIRNKCYVYK